MGYLSCIVCPPIVIVFYLSGRVPVAKLFLISPLEKWYLIKIFTTPLVVKAVLF